MNLMRTDNDLSTDRARAIYQDLLDRISAAYFAGDWPYFSKVIAVPHRMTTFDGEYEITDTEQLHRMFTSMQDRIVGHGITNFARICEAAVFHGPDEIEGMHMSHLLRHGTYVNEPFPSKSILRRSANGWQVHASDNAMEAGNALILALHAAGCRPKPQSEGDKK